MIQLLLTSRPIIVDEWISFAITYDAINEEVKLYRNGEELVQHRYII